MAVDHWSGFLDEFRAALTTVVAPVYFTADLPGRAVRGADALFSSREDLRARVAELEREQLLLKAKTGKMAALTAENNRLRDLLGSAAKVQDNVLVAELVSIDPDPDRHEVIIDKGRAEGVFVGQPVLDADGLLGQVISVGPYVARVLLISDTTHSVPVQVARSSLRLVAQGTGATGLLDLVHVQATADIREGDLLVSSGLGNRFPAGYPVGTVDRIYKNPGKPFLDATARPSAALSRSQHVLLVFTDSQLGDGDSPVEADGARSR